MKSQRYPDRVAVRNMYPWPYTNAQVREARKRAAAKRYLASILGVYVNLPTDALVRLCQGVHRNRHTA